jgi:cytochrome c peroxidase
MMTRAAQVWATIFLLATCQWAMAAFSNGSDRLITNDEMTSNQYLGSSDGRFRFYLQSDGNLVLRVVSTSQALWSSATNGKGGVRLKLQTDGNLVLRNKAGSAVWSSKTNGLGSVRFTMQSDGNAVLYNSGNKSVWSTGTVYAPADTTKPVITLNGNANMSVTRGAAFTDPGATASDNIDGNITSRIVKTGSVNTSTAGTYTLRYDVKDNAGNAATTVTRTVTVTAPAADTIKPVITLAGSAIMSVTQGATFTDPGATATDNVDGNITSRIVLTGSVNTGTVGTYTLRYDVKDNAGNAATTVTRTVNVIASTPNPTPTPGNGDNDGSASSTGQFSAPSAALYSVNNAKQRTFPRHIDTGFGGNGHAETWDGRVFVRTRTAGWFASTFRPQRIFLNSDGSPNFANGAFGNSVALELDADVKDMQHNWIAIMPDPAVTGENPYPSNSSGAFSASGTYRTYKAMVYHTSLRNGDNDQMGLRKATIIVSNANTADAEVVSARFTTSFAKLTLSGGADFRCIEPSATIDGRLIICQGHPNNDGRIDNLVYSWNSTAGATTNWRAPKSIANMYYDDRNATIAGIAFRVRYPIAERPLRDAAGTAYASGELVKGAYPWISHDGSELFYQATRVNADNSGARRSGTTVVGRWTGWAFRHIDGPINRNRHATSRLFLSSPGAFSTMWIPYKDVADLKIPYSVNGPSYPIFGSNAQDYSEVAFDDYLDGNYVMNLGMNEQLARDGTYMKTSTSDTSGNFNNGALVGARFPLEFNNNDNLVGRVGQAIHFNSSNYVNVTRARGWDTLREGFTVDFWVRQSSGSGTVRLFTMQNGIEVYLANGNTLTGVMQDTAGVRKQLNGTAISNGQWVHVAFSYNAFNKNQSLWVNGNRVANTTVSGFGTLQTSGAVQVGPVNSTASMILDDVKVSNVARHAHEIAHNAYSRSHRAPSSTLLATIPSHLSSLRNQATAVDRFSTAAADLGEDLFNDVILSKQRTTSCATCHQAGLAFTDGNAIARGNEPTDAGVRNAPSLLNRLFSSFQGWSGNAASLDRQALIPIPAAHEMNLPIAEAIQRLTSNATYNSRFQSVYSQAPNAENIVAALASFQATLFAPRNRVDEYRAGNRSALTAAEARGLLLFEGKARCSGCHAGQNYTDESFRNNGLTVNADIGRADQTGRNRDFRLQKVPALRELKSTAPYMHDGSIDTLLEVIASYNAGGLGDPMADTDIRPLELSNQEILDLEAFLKALSAN